MITIFGTTKAFTGRNSIIQRNALRSWSLLNPRPEILIFGDEKGTEDQCHELGFTHIKDVETSELGTPLISDFFIKAQKLSKHDLLCYVNADIILSNHFIMVFEWTVT